MGGLHPRVVPHEVDVDHTRPLQEEKKRAFLVVTAGRLDDVLGGSCVDCVIISLVWIQHCGSVSDTLCDVPVRIRTAMRLRSPGYRPREVLR